LRVIALAAVLGVAVVIVGSSVACTPEIGDKCQISTDCSIRGDRLCDTSQPGGYCTQLNCRGNSCADEAACVLFNSAVPGCGYDDRSGPFGSRVARSFCMKGCTSNGDCRGGYICGDPRVAPWNAVILDDDQNKRGCLPVASAFDDAGADAATEAAAVCSPTAPPSSSIDAGAAQIFEGGAPIPPLFPTNVGPIDAGADG
jgi:hypothetical protein